MLGCALSPVARHPLLGSVGSLLGLCHARAAGEQSELEPLLAVCKTCSELQIHRMSYVNKCYVWLLRIVSRDMIWSRM